MSRSQQEFFITLSKYNRGSMSLQEIEIVKNYFDTMDLEQVFIVNEHKNFKQENFEHLHIYVLLKTPKRSDKLRDSIKKAISFVEHAKDLDIRTVSDKDILLGGYMVKKNDSTIILSKGLTEEYMNNCKEKVDINKDLKSKFKSNSIKKNRIYKADVPYYIYEFINDNQILYDCSLTHFTAIIKEMLLKNYDFELRGLAEVKAKLDLFFGDSTNLCAYVEDQFKHLQLHSCDSKNYIIDISYKNVKENLNYDFN